MLFNHEVYWECSSSLFLLLISSLIFLPSENLLFMISILLNLLRCIFTPRTWLVCLGEYSLLVWEECVLCCWIKYSVNARLDLVDWWCCSVQLYSCRCFANLQDLRDVSVTDKLQKSPAEIVDSSVSLFSSLSFCIVYFDALLLGIYTLRIIMSAGRIDPFITVFFCSFLFLTFFFSMKSALCEINVATPAFFWFVFAWYTFLYPFTFNLSVSLYLKLTSYRQHILVSYLSFTLISLYFYWCIQTVDI